MRWVYAGNWARMTLHAFPPPSQYHVSISEAHSEVTLYSGWDYAEYTSLAHVPLRPLNDYYTLTDVLANGNSLEGSHINILAVVRDVRIIVIDYYREKHLGTTFYVHALNLQRLPHNHGCGACCLCKGMAILWYFNYYYYYWGS